MNCYSHVDHVVLDRKLLEKLLKENNLHAFDKNLPPIVAAHSQALRVVGRSKGITHFIGLSAMSLKISIFINFRGHEFHESVSIRRKIPDFYG